MEKHKTSKNKYLKDILVKRGIDKTKRNKYNILPYIMKALLILVSAIIIYNFFLLAFSAKTDKEAKYVFGYRAYVIITDSMKPNLNIGDIILIQKTENDQIDTGDIVTYKVSENSERITHRIVEKSSDIYVTKGDNNKLEDKNIVRFENIEGKYIYKIPFIGKIFLKAENLLYVFFISIIILTLYLYNRRTYSKSEIRRQKKEYADLIRKNSDINNETINENENEDNTNTDKNEKKRDGNNLNNID